MFSLSVFLSFSLSLSLSLFLSFSPPPTHSRLSYEDPRVLTPQLCSPPSLSLSLSFFLRGLLCFPASIQTQFAFEARTHRDRERERKEDLSKAWMLLACGSGCASSDLLLVASGEVELGVEGIWLESFFFFFF